MTDIEASTDRTPMVLYFEDRITREADVWKTLSIFLRNT
jgi:hypothetical protein